SAPEITRALRGSYGAYWRVSPGQRSVTLYSAVPIRRGDQVLGAVLVSQSTFRVLQKLYTVRLSVFKIFLVSVFAAILLSLLVSKTIASPLRDLQQRASRMAERNAELRSMFEHSTRRDEIGDLERALAELSSRLEDRIQFIESFASDLSHELKNPLASIRTATDLVREIHDSANRNRFLQVIETEVARMEHLISRVHEVTSVDSNIEQETRQVLCLNHFLKEFLEGFELLHSGIVTTRLKAPSSLLYVEIHPDHLAQVMENLLVNSISFSAENSTIDVSLTQNQRWAIVSVRDYGPGIPEEHREKIFDRFFSHRPGKKGAKSHHAGLGLAIVRAIIEGYGGRVEASGAPGNGAVFNFRLKIATQVKIDPGADLD
ncbi:MAG: ATP-binding protein, partial [bacterium]